MTLSDIFSQFTPVELNIMANTKKTTQAYLRFPLDKWDFNYFIYFVVLFGGWGGG